MTNRQTAAQKVDEFVAVLAESSRHMKAAGPGTWWVSFPERPSAPVRVWTDGTWCSLDIRPSRRSTDGAPGPRQTVMLLSENGTFPAYVNYSLTVRRGSLLLSAECLLDSGASADDRATRVREMCQEMCQAFRRTLDATTAPSGRITAAACGQDVGEPLSVDDAAGEAAELLCRETGWPFHVRADGQLAITLDVPGNFCQAYVHRVGPDDYRLCAHLEPPAPVSATSTHAIGLFLLTATRVVRLARVAACGDARSPNYRWETACSALPQPGPFDAALSALSVACRVTSSELPAFGDEAIAAQYLTLRGWSP